ncbi:Pectinesterase inhibitor domain containing protein [Parasponia andersonii]|uniref:Pectinesterase inhibitor domain containing protein n=1 Tax=Parasponia andersonii TaxID=3476 RepID=A0A2P5BYC8_PARAD|nr:Pectinesterase inhibitor domain containing protein [Parasponia andersonii]
MAKLGFSLVVLSSLLVLLNILNQVESAITITKQDSNSLDFIKASCKATTYPSLCVRSLSSYADKIRQSQRQLAQTALAVSLSRAQSAADFVSKMTSVKGIKPRELGAVKDCTENMGDTIDRLSQSIRELGHMGRAAGQDFAWHVSNVQTWVSAALTDENTCLDGFAGRYMDGNVKTAIRTRVVGVAQVTSNALALVNRFASKHAPASSMAAAQEP